MLQGISNNRNKNVKVKSPSLFLKNKILLKEPCCIPLISEQANLFSLLLLKEHLKWFLKTT